MSADYPPDNFTLHVRRWLAEEVYPQSLGESFDDRAAAVWIDGSRGFVALWAGGFAAGHDPESRLALCQHELFRRIYATKFPPPVPPHPDPLIGQLRAGLAFSDHTGPRLPVFCHAGDLIGQGLRFGLAHVTPALDQIAAAGYHGVRSWINVEPHPWWADKPAPSWSLLDDPAAVRAILDAGASRGLTWHLASGGLAGLRHARQRELFDALADLVGAIGPWAFALIEACNEARDTTDRGDESPAHLASLVARVSTRYPSILTALTAYTGTEERDVLRPYTPDAQPFTYVHGYRGGRLPDKLRHVFSFGYERPIRRLGWQGEPTGPGRLVSATEHQDELTTETLPLLAAMAAMSRQAWTYMSGPGVILGDEGGFAAMPGFAEVPALVRRLPRDVMTWPTLGHGGESQSGQRIHAARGDVRADYAIAQDGRYLEIVYGPLDESHALDKERATTDVQRLHQCAWGRVEVGRLA